MQAQGTRVAARSVHQHRVAAPSFAPHIRSRGIARAAAQSLQTPVPAPVSAQEQVKLLQKLQQWLQQQDKLPKATLEPKRFKADAGERVGFIASRDIKEGQAVLQIPESAAITSIDAEKHEVVGEVAAGCSQLVALTLWLMAERAEGEASAWAPLLQTLPQITESPILWDDKERAQLLQGSAVLLEARKRHDTLLQQWSDLTQQHFAADAAKFPPSVFNEANFCRCFCVILATAVYLPSAECFALLPMAGLLGRTGNDNGCNLDYDAEQQAVVVTAGRPYREGQEVLLNDGRPNGELLLSLGVLQDNNLSDCLTFPATLVPADRYFSLKQQILESFGFSATENFPVYMDKFPIQLLAYLRLSRVQDPGLLAKVAFDDDVIISQMNEYEVLQLLMGDCRERLAGYKDNLEDDIKALQGSELQGRARLAAKLRVMEKKIVSQFMDAVRRRLAPIRGIPTKAGGMQDPNQDLREIFEVIEDLPKKPAQLFDGLKRWAAGEFDPTWKK